MESRVFPQHPRKQTANEQNREVTSVSEIVQVKNINELEEIVQMMEKILKNFLLLFFFFPIENVEIVPSNIRVVRSGVTDGHRRPGRHLLWALWRSLLGLLLHAGLWLSRLHLPASLAVK